MSIYGKRGSPPTPNHQRRMGLRTQGYNDGLAGRDLRFPDEPEYRSSYRRGTERAAQIREEER